MPKLKFLIKMVVSTPSGDEWSKCLLHYMDVMTGCGYTVPKKSDAKKDELKANTLNSIHFI